jgi:two-component system, NarL family, sensor histidine kinase UhpB
LSPMYGLSHVIQTDELAQIAFDSLRERICVLDSNGTIVLTNQTWTQSARENGGNSNRCGPGVNYLRICRTAAGPFSERAAEAATGIETVLRGAAPQFTLDYPCPAPSRNAWFRLVARPLRQPHCGAVVLHSEITNQVALAEKLRRTQAHYSALLENPVDAATVLAEHGNIRYQSPASEGVLGMRPEEMVGHPMLEFVHPDDVETLRGLLRKCLRHPHIKHRCEYRFRCRSGSWRTVESVGRKLLSNPGGEIVLNTRDVTDQRMVEKTLLAKQDALVRGRADLEALAARLFREREEERHLVAVQLNGKLNQRLAAMSLQAAHLGARADDGNQLQALQDCIASLGRDLHHLGGDLYPAMLDHFGLAVALRDYCAEFTCKQGIPVNYVHRGISTRLPLHTASTLYRVAEEALANIARHAHAQQAWVTLSRNAKGLRLAIHDDGAGFDPAAADPGSGLGILAMRERLRAVNGSLAIRSRPGAGTEVVARALLSSAGNQACAPVARNVIVDPLDEH